jgi:sugar lactone lactonase YvrE
MTRARLALVPLALAGGLLAAALPAAAAPPTTSYAIPGTAVYPEGITARGNVFYVTSTTDGTLYRGTTSGGALRVFEPGGTDGRSTAIGLEVTRDGGRLVVAGGGTGQAFVYDTKDGRLVAKYTNGKTSGTFLNDVAIARNGDAYVTDSQSPVVYRIPADQIARGTGTTRPLQVFRDFRGTAFSYGEGFNANGITLSPDGKALVIVASGTGRLYRVDLATKAVSQVDLGGRTLVNGDGIELRGTVLYVNRNANGVLSKVKLNATATRGTVYGQLTDATFRYPTTSAFAGAQLLVVNSQFDVRGTSRTPAPFTVTGLTNP